MTYSVWLDVKPYSIYTAIAKAQFINNISQIVDLCYFVATEIDFL